MSAKPSFRRVFFTPSHGVRIVWKILGFIVAINILGIGLDLLLRLLNKGRPTCLPFHSGDALIAIGATSLAVKLEGRSIASIGLKFDTSFFIQLIIGFMVAVAMVLLTASPIYFSNGIGSTTGLGFTVLLTGLASTFGIAIFEECLFRGYAFQRLVDGIGPRFSLLVFALMFAIPHLFGRQISPLIRLAVVVNGAIVAVFLGSIFLKSRSLAACIGWHWAWNWALGPLLGFPVSGVPFQSIRIANIGGLPVWMGGGGFGPEASLSFTAIGLLALLLLSRTPNQSFNPGAASARHRPILPRRNGSAG